MICKIISHLSKFNFVQKTTQMQLCERVRYITHNLKYAAPANPQKTIYIDPNKLEYANLNFSRKKGRGQVRNGGWDSPRNVQEFNQLPRVRGVKQRFEEGYKWEDTDYYKLVDYEFENPPRKHKSPIAGIEKYYDRFEYIEALYRDIKKHGYMQDHGGTINKGKFNKFEPLVAIDRDGNYIFNDGRHRVAIAQVLNLDKIPCHVLVRHRDWQKIRDWIYTSNSNPYKLDAKTKTYLDHPDLEDIN